jgi:hypothetical protein
MLGCGCNAVAIAAILPPLMKRERKARKQESKKGMGEVVALA